MFEANFGFVGSVPSGNGKACAAFKLENGVTKMPSQH